MKKDEIPEKANKDNKDDCEDKANKESCKDKDKKKKNNRILNIIMTFAI